MEVRNAPRRALRKFRKDGFRNLCREGRDTLLDDFLLYRIFYESYLENRIDIVDRDELRQRTGSHQYDRYTASVRLKGSTGFRGLADPEEYQPGSRFVSEIVDATILGPIGPALTPDGSVIADSVGTPLLSPRRTGVTLSRSITNNGARSTLKALSGKSDPDQRIEMATLAAPPWKNYYHWTVECLIRIRLLEKYGSKTGKYPVLLVPSELASWMEESLELVNYSGEVASLKPGVVEVGKLVVPTFPDPIPKECFWIRDRVLAEVDNEARSDQRVFISREDATVRQIANRDAVQRVLDKHNINTYVLSELTVRNQIKLFDRAELVVSPHGAGLTNIIYGSDITVLELFGEKTMATFDRIAENMGHQYNHLKCEQVGIDIHVDANSLDDKLEQIIN